MIEFTWDPVKDLMNQRKHGVSFEETKTAFLDEARILYRDIDHSEGTVIRIISARKATKRESEVYLNQ